MILLFKSNTWKVLYISKSDSQRRGPKAPQCHNITVTELFCWLNVMELSRNIWSVQLYNMYSIKPPEWGQVDSEAPHTVQINLIFPIPSVQEEKSCSYWVSDRKQNENHIMRDRGVPKAPFWEEEKRWSCQEHTATEDWTQSEILVPIAVCCCTAAGSSPPLWLASGHWSTPFTPKRVMGQWCLFLSQWPLFVECVLHLCVYLSVWLLVMVERDDEMIWISRPLRCLSWVMYGSHTGRLEFGKVESKFILHPSKGSCSQVVTSNVVHIDGRKLWDSRLGFGFGSSWTTAERIGHDESFHNQSCLVTL